MMDALEPYILEILGIIITAAIAFAAAQLKRWTGIEIEAKHREALHSAMMSGVESAMQNGPSKAADMLVEEANAYAKATVPDAISKLAPDNFILQRLAERYVRKALDRLPGFAEEAPATSSIDYSDQRLR